MNSIEEYMENASEAIKDKGYLIESKSYVESGEPACNISYYDSKHIAKYSFVVKLKDNESHVKLMAIFLSGMEEDIEKKFDGRVGSITIENIGKSQECRITYEIKAGSEILDGCDLTMVLEELEDSIYKVRYRKYFAL